MNWKVELDSGDCPYYAWMMCKKTNSLCEKENCPKYKTDENNQS